MRQFLAAAFVAFALLTALPAAAGVPIVYCTDLYHPPNDPDDHYDLLTLFAMPEFDIRGIVIDADTSGKHHAAVGALRQAMALSGKSVPYAGGLTANLKSLEDAASDHPKSAQDGVELILRLLRETKEPLTLFATGSLRDFAAAYNREPTLFSSKVTRLYVNAGHSGGDREWNVEMDPLAYVRILRSGLPVYWVPCFGKQYGSRWTFRQGTVLAEQAAPVQNFFLYMLTKSQEEPLAYLRRTPDAEAVKTFWKDERPMWCTAAFLHAAGRSGAAWGFASRRVVVEDSGATRVAESGGVTLQTFEVRDPQKYPEEMTQTLVAELRRLPKH